MSYSWGVGISSARTEGIPVIPALLARPALRARGASSDGGDMHQLAAELAPMVDVWRRMLVQHVADRAGRCRTCTKGGTGLPAVPWPCSLYGVADLARRRHTEVLAHERMSDERVS